MYKDAKTYTKVSNYFCNIPEKSFSTSQSHTLLDSALSLTHAAASPSNTPLCGRQKRWHSFRATWYIPTLVRMATSSAALIRVPDGHRINVHHLYATLPQELLLWRCFILFLWFLKPNYFGNVHAAWQFSCIYRNLTTGESATNVTTVWVQWPLSGWGVWCTSGWMRIYEVGILHETSCRLTNKLLLCEMDRQTYMRVLTGVFMQLLVLNIATCWTHL